MLISAGRLGPANMAKSKKMRKEADREKERKRDIQCSYKLGSIKKKNIVRSHVNENDLMRLPAWC